MKILTSIRRWDEAGGCKKPGRQGLCFCPDSAALKALAAKEGVEVPEELLAVGFRV